MRNKYANSSDVESLIKQVSKIRRFNKGMLMDIVFDKNWNGIDTAIPQYAFDNDKNIRNNLFRFCTDCRTWNYKVIDMYKIFPFEKYIKLKQIVVLYDYLVKHDRTRRQSKQYRMFLDKFTTLENKLYRRGF